ncbi:MAG: hypothetical protein RL743_773, partial [Actinomycetota bacterium]
MRMDVIPTVRRCSSVRRLAVRRRFATCVLVVLCASILPQTHQVSAAPSLRLTWTTATLPAGSSTSLDSLVSTNVAGQRSWLVRGRCTRVGANVVASASGRCSVRITIRLGRTRNFVRFRTFRIVSPMTEAAPPASSGPTPSTDSAVWYPGEVPDKTSGRWVVPIGSYVRGKDVFPLNNTLPAAEKVACEQATKVTQGVVILSFGRQIEGGTTGFGLALSYDDIAQVARAWAGGLARCARGPWELALGTSNSGGLTLYNGFTGGKRWAEMLAAVRAVADPRVIVSGANDLEPGWGPAGQARAWVDGFVRTNSAIRLWNFGSADGCPTTANKIVCGNNWTIDDVIWVSAQAGPNLVVVPQIHTKTGSQARQWARIASRARTLGTTVRFAGMSVQTAACAQVKGGCPTTGISAWDGWQQLRT